MGRLEIKQQSGFTLIELIVVIVILGILAATAMPKLIGMTTASNSAVIRALEGSMRSSNAMIYGEAAAQNMAQLGPIGVVVVNGVTINTIYGYAADVNNLVLNMDISPAGNYSITPLVLALATAPASATCSVTYTPAFASGVNIVPPSYVTDPTGC